MNRRLKSFLALSLGGFLLANSIHSAAGFEIKLPIPKVPVSVPGLPSGTGTIEQTVKKEAIKQIIKELGGDNPTQISLDVRKHFKTVKVENFHGKEIKIYNQADLFRFYEPGDYWFNFYGICNKGSNHSPSQGIPTLLGRASGKRLPIVSEIGFAAIGTEVDPRLMQYLGTTVESGLPFRSWRPELQKVARKLIPMYIPDLQGDPVEELRTKYASIRSKSPLKLPDLEGFLQQYMPEEWQLYQEVQRERKILTDERIAAEHVPERLIVQDGTPAQLPPYQGKEESEWGEIAPGVYGRAIIIRGFAGMPGPAPYNRFELRITKEARSLFTQRATRKALVKAGKTSPVTKPPVVGPGNGTGKPSGTFDPGKVKGQGGNVISYPFGKPGTTLAETLYEKRLVQALLDDPRFWALFTVEDIGEYIGAQAMQYYLDHNPEVRKWMTEAMNTSPKQAAQSLTIGGINLRREKTR